MSLFICKVYQSSEHSVGYTKNPLKPTEKKPVTPRRGFQNFWRRERGLKSVLKN